MPKRTRLADLTLAIARALGRPDEPRPSALGGPPVVLLHGFGTSSRMLSPLARHLERRLRRPTVRVRLGRTTALHLGDVRESARRVHAEIERLAAASPFPYVDVVGYSLGGLVATYLLKVLDRGRRIRRVVTLGTPHRGTPIALLGVLLFGAFSRAIWQMIPGSPLLRELAQLPVPASAELVALESDADGLVPVRFAQLATAPRQSHARIVGLGHLELICSRSVFQLVQHALV